MKLLKRLLFTVVVCEEMCKYKCCQLKLTIWRSMQMTPAQSQFPHRLQESQFQLFFANSSKCRGFWTTFGAQSWNTKLRSVSTTNEPRSKFAHSKITSSKKSNCHFKFTEFRLNYIRAKARWPWRRTLASSLVPCQIFGSFGRHGRRRGYLCLDTNKLCRSPSWKWSAE